MENTGDSTGCLKVHSSWPCVALSVSCRQWRDQSLATSAGGKRHEYVHRAPVATLRVKQEPHETELCVCATFGVAMKRCS